MKRIKNKFILYYNSCSLIKIIEHGMFFKSLYTSINLSMIFYPNIFQKYASVWLNMSCLRQRFLPDHLQLRFSSTYWLGKIALALSKVRMVVFRFRKKEKPVSLHRIVHAIDGVLLLFFFRCVLGFLRVSKRVSLCASLHKFTCWSEIILYRYVWWTTNFNRYCNKNPSVVWATLKIRMKRIKKF